MFKNEMSFIGPRPPIIDEVNQYELKHLKEYQLNQELQVYGKSH